MIWDRIRGHDAAVSTFQTAAARGRFGQAYLFVGPEGIGKQLFARELTKALLCDSPPAPLTACGRCPACAQVEAETHPDIFYARIPDDKQELIIDVMREFCARMSLKPSRGPRKVGIVVDADDFNEESANAFLKTLEEPPKGAVVLLLATELDRQLPTILSRCQVVRFSPLVPSDLRAVLLGQGIDDPAQLDRLVRMAGGSPARALALNDEVFWKLRRTLIDGVTAPRPSFVDLAEAWQNYNEAAGKESRGQRLRASLVVGILIETLERALRLACGAEVGGLDKVEEERLSTYASRLGPERLLELIDACVEADSRIERKAQLILVVDSVIDRFVRQGETSGTSTR